MHDLVGQPLHRAAAEQRRDDQVRDAGLDPLHELAAGGRDRVRFVAPDDQLHGPGDLGRIPANGRAVLAEHLVALPERRIGRARVGPDVGVLGHHVQQPFALAADHHRRVRALHRLGLAHGAGEPDGRPGEVERLVAGDKGLVERRPDAEDRRRNVVVLTGAGQATMAEAVEAAEAAEQRFLTKLSAAEAASLRAALQRLL